jgi:2-oxoglutarate ferredoxin oxidoreductase subunit alpha
VPVLAPATPGDCFYTMLEAFSLAVAYMTPVIVLSDSYLANSAEPWRVPDVLALPRMDVVYANDPATFKPYARDPETLARPWATPGTPGLEHRIGGLSKENISGNVSYDSKNNETMVRLRAEKVARIASAIPPVEVNGPATGELLVVGWGGTHGAILSAVDAARSDGLDVSSIHLRHLNPFPANLGEVLGRFRRVLVPELNLGQLSRLLRAEFLTPAVSLTKVQGQPFQVAEIHARIAAMLREEN